MQRSSAASPTLQSKHIYQIVFRTPLTIEFSVIVATGLIALVDDSIKSKFHQKNKVHMSVPAMMRSPLKMNMEYVGPKQLIDEIFHRRGTTATRRPTPLRQISARA